MLHSCYVELSNWDLLILTAHKVMAAGGVESLAALSLDSGIAMPDMETESP